MLIAGYTIGELIWVGVGVFLLGMAKGGFPVGPVALPFLVLMWPGMGEAAKDAVTFMLPMLCMMDVVAVTLYRKHIQWHKLLKLMPGSLVGVALASLLFADGGNGVLTVSDDVLKLMIGCIGISFVVYRAWRKVILKHVSTARPDWKKSNGFGFAAGVTSTIAHAGGPVMQMYFLPQGMIKFHLAGTLAGFFFCLNLVKLVPFTLYGRFTPDLLLLDAVMIPLIPLGVASGFFCVKKIRETWYIPFLYCVLLATSVTLVVKAVRGMGV